MKSSEENQYPNMNPALKLYPIGDTCIISIIYLPVRAREKYLSKNICNVSLGVSTE
jgi:hypothetical protein